MSHQQLLQKGSSTRPGNTKGPLARNTSKSSVGLTDLQRIFSNRTRNTHLIPAAKPIIIIYGCLTLLLSLLPGTGVSAQETQLITLSELQRQATDRAESVLIAGQRAESAELDLIAYRAALKPRLDLVGNLPNYFRTSTEVTQDDGTIAFREIELNNSSAALLLNQRIGRTGGRIGLETRLQRTDNFAQSTKSYNGAPVRLRIDQPIFAFNPWKWDRDILPLAARVTRSQLDAARAEAALQATQLFFDLVSADQERQIATTNRGANETLYRIAEERFELGKITRGDLVQLELELASAEQNLLRAERLVTAASAAIQNYLGRDYDGTPLSPVTPAVGPEMNNLRIAADRARAGLAGRPELLDITRQNLLAQRDADRTKRDLGPQLNFNASIGLIRGAETLEPVYTDPRDEATLSLTLAIPIVDWGERKALNKQAETLVALTRVQGKRVEQSLDNRLTQLLDQWTTIQQELALAANIRDLAQERFRISQESYQLGAIPLTELTLAQQIRDQNTRAYAATLRNYWLTYASLESLTLWDFINDEPLYQ